MTKKQILVSSVIAVAIFGVLYTNYLPHTYCPAVSVSDCADYFAIWKITFLISIALLPMAILASFFQEKVFLLWRKFTLIYLFIYLFSILISPSYGGDFIKIEKGTVAIFLSVLYALLSLLIITIKSWKLKKENTKI